MNEQMDVAAVDVVFSGHEQLTPAKPDKEIIMARWTSCIPSLVIPFGW